MKLVIEEKPSVAMALAQVVSATARKDGIWKEMVILFPGVWDIW